MPPSRKHGCAFKRTASLCAAIFLSSLAALLCSAQTGTWADTVPNIVTALQGQNFDQALRLCGAALEKTPNDYRVWTLRGMAYSGKAAMQPALDAFNHALKLKPNYLPALEGAAQVEFQQGSPAAKPLLQQVLQQRPADPTSHAMLGLLDYRDQLCPGAVSHFEQAGELLATQPGTLAAYGACLATLGRFDDAVPVLERALAAEPGRRPVRYNLALAQWKADRAGDALATLQPSTEGTGQTEEFLLLAADIDEAKGDTNAALALLRKAILANPKHAAAYLDFAYLSYDHASPQVGIDILDAGLTQLPADAQLYLARGVLYAQLGKFQQATEDFEAANRLDPNLSFTGTAQGIVETQQHRSSEALATFRAAAKAHPQDALTQYLLAEALSQQTRTVHGREDAEAVAAAQLALRLDPRMASAHDLLATLYLEDGQVQLAIEQSHAALAADPNDSQAVYHLILALRKTGQKDQLPGLLRQLTAMRAGAQAGAAEKNKFRLQELPAASATQ